MNAFKKRIGDRVIVTAGEFKGRIGTITQQQPRGWIIELEDSQQVSIPFPSVRLADQPSSIEQAIASIGEESTQAQVMEASETESLGVAERAATSEIEQAPVVAQGELNGKSIELVNVDFTKLGVVQLKELAKRRGVSIARTKEDFLRIIKEKFPEEDLDLLKGRILFDRVSELHISRLRSKRDLIERLSVE